MENPPVMKSYRSNKIAEPQQQTLIENKSTKRDPSSTGIPTTYNQMSRQGIETDVVFYSKPQAVVS